MRTYHVLALALGCAFLAGCPVTPPSTQCSSDSDCNSGETCTNGECVAASTGCTSDADCADGETCTDGECVANSQGCTSDADCADGETCENGACESDDSGNSDCSTLTGVAADGETFFTTNGCNACHGADGSGVSGPDIRDESCSEIMAQLTANQGHLYIADVTAQQTADVVAYLDSLQQ